MAAILLLGPLLGRALAGPGPGYWGEPIKLGWVKPEPTEQARYLLSLMGPLVLAGVTWAFARLRPRSHPIAVSILVSAGRIAVVVFVVAAVLGQRGVTYGTSYDTDVPFRTAYFTTPTLVAAVVVAAGLLTALRSGALVDRLRRVFRESRAKQIAAFAAGLLVIAIWMLTAFNDDTSLGTVNGELWDSIPFWTDESFAILNGQAPLVDFHAQYAQLWSYVAAGALALFGTSFAVYASVMILATTVTMLALLDVFRRLVASSLVALLLFLPFLATSFFIEVGPPDNRYGPANLFSFFPVRYGGPYVLLWLVVRRLERRPEPPPILLFAVAGLVVINNPEFGVPALGATLAALIAAERSRAPPRIARLLGSVLAGLAGAVALVAVLTLTVAGSWPRFGMLATFSRIFSAGFGLLPMPTIGFHLVLYATFAAAIVTAMVRVLRVADDMRLTGALLWAGVFGLGTGAYFVGRSHPHVLIDLFSAWALALSLLVIVAVRGIVERPGRRPGAVEALLFACLGLSVCSIAQTPPPWTQWHRIASAQPDGGRIERFVASQRAAVAAATRKAEPVALLMREGHRIAEDVGVVDVVPYANIDSMPTRVQWTEMVRALRRAGGTKILVPAELLFIEQAKWLVRSGFRVRQTYDEAGLIEFVARS